MFRFESIPPNNKRGVPFVVRKRRERDKLTKDNIPFGLMLFFLSSALLVAYIPLWVCGVPRALNTKQNSVSHCYGIYGTVH